MSNEIWLYDEIGPARWGLIDGQAVAEALAAFKGKAVTIRINSPGGSVFEAKAICSSIRRHAGKVTGVVDGIAASCASWILQECDVRLMNAGTHQMVHGPWTMAQGNKQVMRDTADKLEMFEAAIREDYARKWAGSDEELDAVLLSEETWYPAETCVEKGVADEVLDAEAVAACLPAGMWNFAPQIESDARAARLREQLAGRRVSGDIRARRDQLDLVRSRLA